MEFSYDGGGSLSMLEEVEVLGSSICIFADNGIEDWEAIDF